VFEGLNFVWRAVLDKQGFAFRNRCKFEAFSTGGCTVDLLLFIVFTFCKVATNAELAKIVLLLLGDTQGWVPKSLWLQHFHQLLKM
jgi:hypothetical protein